MKRNLHLLVIDPQNDFCDLPADYRPISPTTQIEVASALPVAGAHADMLRLAEFINKGVKGFSDLSLTLDSHHLLDIAHPTMWMNANGSPVTPFTAITSADIRAGKYITRNPALMPRALAYTDTLEATGRYTLFIWPVHCEIGSWGHNVHADVREAYNRWEAAEIGIVNKVTKGSNPWTEHYSAVMAEVPDPADPSTQLNTGLIHILAQSDVVYIAGEASSHCVKATTEHIAANFDPVHLSKLVLLTDCMSAVTGFEAQHDSFFKDMSNRGVQLAKSTDVLPDLVANSRR